MWLDALFATYVQSSCRGFVLLCEVFEALVFKNLALHNVNLRPANTCSTSTPDSCDGVAVVIHYFCVLLNILRSDHFNGARICHHRSLIQVQPKIILQLLILWIVDVESSKLLEGLIYSPMPAE